MYHFNRNTPLIRVLLFVVIGLTLSYACSSNILRNHNVLEEEQFIDVLVDIHFADAIIVVKGLRVDTDSTNIRLYYSHVLAKHNTTQKQLKATFEYYSQKPRKFEKLYEKVSERIVKLEEESGVNKEEKEK